MTKTTKKAVAKKSAAKKVEAPAVLRPQKRIAIFGTTPSRMEGPTADDSGWHRWTIGPGGKDAHGWERLFEMHTVWPLDFGDYLNDLSQIQAPREVWTLAPMPKLIQRWAETHDKVKELPELIKGDWQANRVYPKDPILAKYCRAMWFSSSIAWLIPLAIEEGATTIGLWGIDLESGEEYISQFVGCAHFIDLARLAGIDIMLPDGCGLLRDPNPYPERYETLFALTLEKKKKWLQSHLGNMEPAFESTKAEVHRQEGRLLVLKHLVNGQKVTEADIQECERILVENNKQLGQIGANVNQLRGELSATEYYQRMFVWNMLDPQMSNASV